MTAPSVNQENAEQRIEYWLERKKEITNSIASLQKDLDEIDEALAELYDLADVAEAEENPLDEDDDDDNY